MKHYAAGYAGDNWIRVGTSPLCVMSYFHGQQHCQRCQVNVENQRRKQVFEKKFKFKFKCILL